MEKNRSACSEAPVAWRFPDTGEELFWREHLQRLDDPAKIEALCRREYEGALECFQRGVAYGDYDESERALIVGTLAGVRRWWAGELLKMGRITAAEREWAQRVLSTGWF